jgi:hypothetical protein
MRINQKSIRKNLAVSEIMGTIILLGISTTSISGISYYVLSAPAPVPAPIVEISGMIEDNHLIVTHRGGEPLDLDTVLIVNIGGNTNHYKAGDFLDSEAKDDGMWNLGEKVIYPIFDYYESSNDNEVKFMMSDSVSNSLIIMGSAIIDQTSDLIIEAIEDTLHTLHAHSTKNEKSIEWSGSKNTINGDFHSNGGILISGSDNNVKGSISYVNQLEIAGENNNIYKSIEENSSKSFPVVYNILDYQPGGIEAEIAQNDGKYHYIDGDFVTSKSNIELNGLYYVTGDVLLSVKGVTGTFTFIAEGNIDISGSKHNYKSYTNDLLFYSNSNLYKIAGSENILEGITYVPNGLIEISGHGNTIVGCFYGDTIKLSGSEISISVL